MFHFAVVGLANIHSKLDRQFQKKIDKNFIYRYTKLSWKELNQTYSECRCFRIELVYYIALDSGSQISAVVFRYVRV